MVQVLEVIKVKLKVGKVCNEVLITAAGYLKPDHPQGEPVFRPPVGDIIHRDVRAYIPVLSREFRVQAFLFGV